MYVAVLQGLFPIFWMNEAGLNERFASNRIPVFAQRTLGSPGGKHCKSLEGNVWRKVVSTSKKRFWGKINAFSPWFYLKRIWAVFDMWKMKVFVWITLKYVIKPTDKPYLREVLLWNLHRVFSENMTNLGINREEITQKNLSSCVKLLLAYFEVQLYK